MHFTVAGDGKYKRGRRVVLNAKHKERDRYKPKRAKRVMDKYPKYRRFRLWARENALADTEPYKSIREGLEDIVAGRYREITSVADLFGED